MSAGTSISVCVLSARRPADLAAFLDSLRAQEQAPPFELLVCANGDPSVTAIVDDGFPAATVVEVERMHPGAARNVLIERATGELLLFVDDDVVLPPGLLRRLGRLADRHPEVGVFGGPNDTPPHSTAFETVQGAVLASIVGSGPVRRRYGPHPRALADERWFILCNLAVRRPVMQAFPDDVVCAEENEVLDALRRRGVAMLYDPDLAVYHRRRGDVGGFLGQMHKYGRGRGQLLRRDPRSVRLPFLVPTAVVAYLVVLPVLAWWSPLTLLPLAAYGLGVLASAANIARTLGRAAALVPAALLTVGLHLGYGTGVPRGVLGRREGPAAGESELDARQPGCLR